MKLLTQNYGEWFVHFRHLRFGPTPQTEALLHEGSCNIVETATGKACISTQKEAFGLARVSPKDHFCRATGRKVAFGHALAKFPKNLRAELWRAFLTVERG